MREFLKSIPGALFQNEILPERIINHKGRIEKAHYAINQSSEKFFSVDSDAKYALFGKALPDGEIVNDTVLRFSVGRIPCESNEQLENYISKVMYFDTGAIYGEWRNGILAIADDGMQGQDVDFIAHQESSDTILNHGFQSRFIYKNYLSKFALNETYEKPDAVMNLFEK